MFSVGIIQMEDPLQERVNYYNIELSKDYSNDEDSLFGILFELFWETAINPATNDLIMNVFKSTHTSQEITTINDAFNYLFTRPSTPHTVINTYNDRTINTIIQSRGERIISVLLLKFIRYFALRILGLGPSSPELCEQLSNLADLVGLTDNERILNAAVIDIGNFLMITTESKDEIRAIIQAIHNIFIQQLEIDIPDNISIQITISVICKAKLEKLKCLTVPDNTPKPKPKTDIKSWDEIRVKTQANRTAGKTRTIVKTELKPLLTLTLTDETSKFRYAPPQQVIKKKKKPPEPIIKQQLPALSLPKAAPAAPVVLPTLSHRVPEAQSRNRGTHSENKLECPHGSACYRKNPEHLRKFYHPGRSPPPETKKPWKGGGGTGKSTRRSRRTATRRTKRRRPSTKRSSKRR